MTVEDRYKERYKAGDTPWDAGQPDFNLIEVVTGRPLQACKALDVGCGTGDNSIWLAQNGFQVVGTDASEVAIKKARQKAAEAGTACELRVVDFLANEIEGAPFGFVFDRGCFHSFPSDEIRTKFADKVAAHLAEGGLWLSLIGNADEIRDRPGPPQRTAADIVLAVEPVFMILSLTTTRFGSKRDNPPRAWRCLMQKRPTS